MPECATKDINCKNIDKLFDFYFLIGMSKTKSMINTCLGEASGSIRAALALAEEADPADTKTRREDVLNQLLVLLNTSTAEKVSGT